MLQQLPLQACECIQGRAGNLVHGIFHACGRRRRGDAGVAQRARAQPGIGRHPARVGRCIDQRLARDSGGVIAYIRDGPLRLHRAGVTCIAGGLQVQVGAMTLAFAEQALGLAYARGGVRRAGIAQCGDSSGESGACRLFGRRIGEPAAVVGVQRLRAERACGEQQHAGGDRSHPAGVHDNVLCRVEPCSTAPGRSSRASSTLRHYPTCGRVRSIRLHA